MFLELVGVINGSNFLIQSSSWTYQLRCSLHGATSLKFKRNKMHELLALFSMTKYSSTGNLNDYMLVQDYSF